MSQMWIKQPTHAWRIKPSTQKYQECIFCVLQIMMIVLAARQPGAGGFRAKQRAGKVARYVLCELIGTSGTALCWHIM